MSRPDPLTCLIIALAHYTSLPPDSDQVKKMARVVIGMAPHLPQALVTGYGELHLIFDRGELTKVAPAPVFLVE